MPNSSLFFQRIDDAWGRLRAACGAPVRCRGHMNAISWPSAPQQPEDILRRHIGCGEDHINYSSMRDVLGLLDRRPAVILETGSSAWGTNSTCLWDSYVQRYGGSVWSVDIRRSPSRTLRNKVSAATTLVADDSVRFLRRWSRRRPQTDVTLVYLDSWDLDPRAPLPAALHCVREYEAIEPHLHNGALLLVDDTPGGEEWLTPDLREEALAYRSLHGLLPGKGMLLDLMLQHRPGVVKLHHRYQALYRFS